MSRIEYAERKQNNYKIRIFIKIGTHKVFWVTADHQSEDGFAKFVHNTNLKWWEKKPIKIKKKKKPSYFD